MAPGILGRSLEKGMDTHSSQVEVRRLLAGPARRVGEEGVRDQYWGAK